MSGLWMRAPSGALVSREELVQLESLGYAPGYEEASSVAGVVIHDPSRAFQGLNLYCSGHAPEAYLMDMDGEIVHSWRLTYEQVPEPLADAHPWFTGSWRRVRLLHDGSLLAIFENLGLVKVDVDSNFVWYFSGGAHHDLDVLADGSIWVLARESRSSAGGPDEPPVFDDVIVTLSREGEVHRRISVLDAFLRSGQHRHLLERLEKIEGDVFHTNTLEVLDGRLESHGPAFRRGNVLISSPRLDVIAILDPDTETIVWTATGSWSQQHEPTALDNGHILLFDNSGRHGFSRVLELDPTAMKITWSYLGNPPESFHSEFCGTASRLPNGNTLVTETCPGRAFEVTPQGTRVWEFRSPHRAGDHGELVAALYDVIRLPDRPGWLNKDDG